MEEPKKKPEPVKPLPKMKPKFVQCHVGVTTLANGAGTTATGLGNKADHKFTMELHPAGVVLRYTDIKMSGKGKLIPYGNIQHMDLEFDE